MSLSRPPVPSPLVIAYPSWGQCDDNVTRAVAHGANVIIWFALNLISVDDRPTVAGSVPDPDAIARVAADMRRVAPHRNILHLVSIGGWNAPLPDTSHTAQQWFDAIQEWNARNARPDLGWHGFHGFDWDSEGNDDPKEVRNHVTDAHLELIGSLSVRLKQAGYVVSLAPAQSYLDVRSSLFDIDLTHSPAWKPDFSYHGHNLFAYWLAFYDTTKLSDGSSVPTFDWVSLQIYEGWSRANNALSSVGHSAAHYFASLVSDMGKGWQVDFASRGGLRTVHVPKERLVIGVANAWTPPHPPVQKFLFIRPDDLRAAWNAANFAGFMFWTINEEGNPVDGKPYFLTKELAAIVNTTSESTTSESLCLPQTNQIGTDSPC